MYRGIVRFSRLGMASGAVVLVAGALVASSASAGPAHAAKFKGTIKVAPGFRFHRGPGGRVQHARSDRVL